MITELEKTIEAIEEVLDNKLESLQSRLQEINEEIGSDSLAFISMEGLVDTLSKGRGYCLGCFSGVYPVAAPIEMPKNRMD